MHRPRRSSASLPFAPRRSLERSPRSTAARDPVCAVGSRALVSAASPSATFGPGRRRREFGNSSRLPAHAHSRPDLETSRARVPYVAGCEFSPQSLLLTGALTSKSKRYLPAYCVGTLTDSGPAQRHQLGRIRQAPCHRNSPLCTESAGCFLPGHHQRLAYNLTHTTAEIHSSQSVDLVLAPLV